MQLVEYQIWLIVVNTFCKFLKIYIFLTFYFTSAIYSTQIYLYQIGIYKSTKTFIFWKVFLYVLFSMKIVWKTIFFLTLILYQFQTINNKKR